MNIRLRAGALALALLVCACAPALAQSDARKYGGQDVNLMSKVTGQTIGDSADRPLYVTGGTGGGGTLPNISYADQDAQTLAASATYTGATHDVGAAVGTANNRGYFNAYFLSSQTGTARIQCLSDAASTWVNMTKDSDGALEASTPLILSIPLMFQFCRVQVVNDVTSATITIHSSFTGS